MTDKTAPDCHLTNQVDQPTPSEYFTYLGSGSREMNWGSLGPDYLVHKNRLYIHNRATPPNIDLDTWTLQVTGSVNHELALTYCELLAMPQVSLLRTLDCGANGRGHFPKYPPHSHDPKWTAITGTEWSQGAVGAAEWTGVRLIDVLDRAGVKPKARSVWVTGLDSISYEHVIPLDKALALDTLIALKMNGEALTPDHGFPARLFCTGWGGNTMVKWVGSIELSEKSITVQDLPKYQKSQVLAGPDYHEPVIVTYNNVKSAFELLDGVTLASGQTNLRGRSWSGYGTIERVEVKIERQRRDGAWAPIWSPEWRQADFIAGTPVLPFCWTTWEIDWDAEPG
ncbi:MAG TPA: molybdopterin-dependent oxidoreductase [Blastocatellia bacterium]|nr:molybdopterin-dependent oxidoreductase [Blastocatellia bacterium]